MVNWYSRVSADLSVIPDFIAHYENELQAAKLDLGVKGIVEKTLSALPGLMAKHFNSLQECEAVLNLLNLQLRKIKRKHFQNYLEKYNRQLTSRDASLYTEGEEEVVDFETIINSVALIRNQYLGIIKGLEQKSFSLSNISKLRTAGMEDVTI